MKSKIKNDLLTLEGIKWIFSKVTISKTANQAEKNELQLGFIVKLLELQIFSYFFVASRTQLKIGIWIRKLGYCSFFSVWCTDFGLKVTVHKDKKSPSQAIWKILHVLLSETH